MAETEYGVRFLIPHVNAGESIWLPNLAMAANTAVETGLYGMTEIVRREVGPWRLLASTKEHRKPTRWDPLLGRWRRWSRGQGDFLRIGAVLFLFAVWIGFAVPVASDIDSYEMPWLTRELIHFLLIGLPFCLTWNGLDRLSRRRIHG